MQAMINTTGKDTMAQEHWVTKGNQRVMKLELNDLWIAHSFQHYQFIILPNKHQIYIPFVRNMTLHSSIFAQINSRVMVAHLIINGFVAKEAIILNPLWNTISWVKELRLGIGSVAQLVERLPCIHRPHVWSLALYKPGLTQSGICVY